MLTFTMKLKFQNYIFCVLGDAVRAQLREREEELEFNFGLVESTLSCMVHLPGLHGCLRAGRLLFTLLP